MPTGEVRPTRASPYWRHASPARRTTMPKSDLTPEQVNNRIGQKLLRTLVQSLPSGREPLRSRSSCPRIYRRSRQPSSSRSMGSPEKIPFTTQIKTKAPVRLQAGMPVIQVSNRDRPKTIGLGRNAQQSLMGFVKRRSETPTDQANIREEEVDMMPEMLTGTDVTKARQEEFEEITSEVPSIKQEGQKSERVSQRNSDAEAQEISKNIDQNAEKKSYPENAKTPIEEEKPIEEPTATEPEPQKPENVTNSKIIPCFRGEYPTRHRPDSYQWFQSSGPNIVAICDEEHQVMGEAEIVTACEVTEAHFLSLECEDDNMNYEMTSMPRCSTCMACPQNQQNTNCFGQQRSSFHQQPYFQVQQLNLQQQQPCFQQQQQQQPYFPQQQPCFQQQQQSCCQQQQPPCFQQQKLPCCKQQQQPCFQQQRTCSQSPSCPNSQVKQRCPKCQDQNQSGNFVYNLSQSIQQQNLPQIQQPTRPQMQQRNLSQMQQPNLPQMQQPNLSQMQKPTLSQIQQPIQQRNSPEQVDSPGQNQVPISMQMQLPMQQKPAQQESLVEDNNCLTEILAEELKKQMLEAQAQIAQVQLQLNSACGATRVRQMHVLAQNDTGAPTWAPENQFVSSLGEEQDTGEDLPEEFRDSREENNNSFRSSSYTYKNMGSGESDRMWSVPIAPPPSQVGLYPMPLTMPNQNAYILQESQQYTAQQQKPPSILSQRMGYQQSQQMNPYQQPQQMNPFQQPHQTGTFQQIRQMPPRQQQCRAPPCLPQKPTSFQQKTQRSCPQLQTSMRSGQGSQSNKFSCSPQYCPSCCCQRYAQMRFMMPRCWPR
ncbi:putative mediator of RNA polymerase II transcription subunit 26 [Drosophila eugracilis]|uniref:putative mediator of RNA polymerase II transcription subunit 26 n=1 Tax=Drosophila eugracilis TaxID=29029 RepID=UPI0007E7AFE0|nr:putative mediator of RNA polymerase II transcription subunit 26 [Drosophila eugracilis]